MAILQPTITKISVNNPQPIVGQVLVSSNVTNTTFYTSKILNYVEPVEIDGILKTIFYTEVNTNVNVGDRVFILNGNYDSDNFIGGNKYTKFSDGYRVLGVDGCKVVLDLNYTGVLPYIKFTSKDFIYVHNITTQKDFDYINSLKVISSRQKPLKSVFGGNINSSNFLQLDCQNIIFASQQFKGSTNPDIRNAGIVDSDFRPGFYVRVEDGSNYPWIKVDFQFVSNSILQNTDFSNSGNIYIVGENFTYDGQEFIQRGIYKYENFTWVFDTKYYQPFLSKVNFRKGKFRGVFNDGIFGTYVDKNEWTDSKWNSGAFVNSIWKDGIMNSKHTIDELSFSAVNKIVGSTSVVLQSTDSTNNRGFGYNFIEDSLFEKFVLNNGNFKNCDFKGLGISPKAIDNYYNTSFQFENKLNGGRYELCDIQDVLSSGGYILNSIVKNSNLNKSKLVSSEIEGSTLKSGFWSSEGGIKILGADIWSYDLNEGSRIGSTFSDISGTLKIYISEEDYFKLSTADTFFISRLNKDIIFNQLTEDQKIYFNLENKFLIDNYTDYTIFPNGKNFRVSLKSTSENKYKTFVKSSANPMPIYSYSIDDITPGYWVKIPSTSFRGQYNPDTEIIFSYKLGDYVYELDQNTSSFIFYLYWPINNNIFDRSYGSRARNTSEEQLFRQNGPLQTTGFGLEDDLGEGLISHWFVVGEFKGSWDINGTYSGTLIPELDQQGQPYAPSHPVGDVVGNRSDVEKSDLLWIFIGSPDTNRVRETIIGTDFFTENSIVESTFNYPSIDISSDAFGYYYDNNDITIGNLIYTTKYGFQPITLGNVNDVLVNNIISNGDFKSGVFDNSTWTIGDNSNYDANRIRTINSNSPQKNYQISLSSSPQKPLIIGFQSNSKLSRTYRFSGYDLEVGDFIWINSLNYYRFGQAFEIDGRYKVTSVGNDSFNAVWDGNSPNPLQNLSPGGTFSTPIGNTNNYFSFNKFIMKDSKIVSGKFRKTLFENCTFENDLFQKYVYPTRDLVNTERLRIVNIFFGRTKNIVKGGLVYKSHFVNNTFDGATFYDSIWYGGQFKDGLFKFSTWVNGTFDGGKFVDCKSPSLFSFDYDFSRDFKLWKNGIFNNGEFFNSLWPRGTFNGGRLYKSDWTGGIWNNGLLGSNTLKTNETTMGFYGPSTSFGATFTIWNNGVVENALVGGKGSLDWYNGKMLGGVFTSDGRTSTNHTIWHNGDFYGSSFEKQAWWKNGKFYSGKFLSEIGWDKVDFLTYSNDTFNYGWVNGEFYGGEFGNRVSDGPNATWFDGLFYDGTFIGKFWKSGLLIDGNFFGDFEESGDISENLLNYKNNFYGLWNEGNVNDTLYDVKKDVIVTNNSTTLRPRSRSARVSQGPTFDKIIWKSGTFSHFDGNFNNSVWLNGNFMSGNFNNSTFNPFVDLTLSGITLTDYKRSRFFALMTNEIDELLNIQQNQVIFQTINNIVQNYDGIVDYDLELVVDFYTDSSSSDPIPLDDFPNLGYGLSIDQIDPTGEQDTTTIMRIREQRIFDKNNNNFLAIFLYYSNGSFTYGKYSQSIDISNVSLGFEERDTCVWTNGNFNSGEFNYSKWISGNFNDGIMNGAIWLNGTFNYGSMYNCYWENGIWRNGNWFGSPFDSTSMYDVFSQFVILDKRADDIIRNIINYTSLSGVENPFIHLSNVVVLETNETQIHNYDPDLGFLGWTFSVDD